MKRHLPRLALVLALLHAAPMGLLARSAAPWTRTAVRRGGLEWSAGLVFELERRLRVGYREFDWCDGVGVRGA